MKYFKRKFEYYTGGTWEYYKLEEDVLYIYADRYADRWIAQYSYPGINKREKYKFEEITEGEVMLALL